MAIATQASMTATQQPTQKLLRTLHGKAHFGTSVF